MRARDCLKLILLLVLANESLALATDYFSTYQQLGSTKVIFSKKFFFNNQNVNGQGCAGDASMYFDPRTDRQTYLGTKPLWLKNISVDLTNSNAPYGPSNAFYCSYGSSTGVITDPACLGPTPPASCSTVPPPSNCAAFDDLQGLTGYQSQSFLIGGHSCESVTGGTGCLASSNGRASATIWSLSMNDTSTQTTPAGAATFTRPTFVLPNTSAADSPSLFTGWAFDEDHNWLIGFGGTNRLGTLGNSIQYTLQRLYVGPVPESVTDPTLRGIELLDTTTTGSFANKLGPLNTTPAPYAGSSGLSNTSTDAIPTDLLPPAPRVGHSFNYVSRRTPALSRRFIEETAGTSPCLPGRTCESQAAPTTITDTKSGWFDSDYFLTIGGITNITGGATTTNLSSGVAALIPHRLSHNDGSGTPFARDAMSWEWLSHFNSTHLTSMKVVDLATTGTKPSNSNWLHTDRFGRDSNGGVFPGRAFHRSVYDSFQNRFYIFGGIITNTGAVTTASTSGGTSDLVAYGTPTSSNLTPTSETWIYDPPNLGQPPTQACQTKISPISNGSLPGLLTSLYNSAALGAGTHVVDHSTFDSETLNYETHSILSPPGGCMQFAQPLTATISSSSLADDGGTVQTYTQPPMRLEHAMAFDSTQGVVILFGGCTSAPTFDSTTGLMNVPAGTPTYPAAGTTNGIDRLPYDPLSNCNSRSSLLNDTWMYIPPDTRESSLAVSLAGVSQYTIDRPDLVNLEPSFLGFPTFFTSSLGLSSTMGYPELRARTNGTWIKLISDDGLSSSSTSQPSARASSAFWYDKTHQKFFLFGGKSCNGTCQYNNDLWEYTPPNISTCSRSYVSSTSEVTCSSSGTWKQHLDHTSGPYYSTVSGSTLVDWPAQTAATTGVFSTRAPGDYYHYGDGFYTVSDAACSGQGPIIGTDSASREGVGAINIDLDRSQFGTNENLLINLKLLPFAGETQSPSGSNNGDGTKLPGYNLNGTYGGSVSDDHDSGTSSDTAYLRIKLMVNPISSIDSILRQTQPRYHTYQEPGFPVVAQEFDLAASGTGQPTEKQIFIPLSLDSRINLIKVERVRGSVKFYDMTVTKF